MLENQQENLQPNQPQKNSEGKKLFLILLVVLCWLFFVTVLLFTSSKCAKATNIYITDSNGTNSFDTGVSYDTNSTYENTTLGIEITYNGTYYTNPNQPYYLYLLMDVNFNNTLYYNNDNTKLVFTIYNNNSYINTNGYVYAPCAYDSNISKCFQIGNLYGTYYNTANNSQSSVTLGMVIATPNGVYFRFNNVMYQLTLKSSSGGGYTQADLDNAYAEGQLNALNTASASTNGSGTVYTEYSATSMISEMSNAYNKGRLYALNYLSSATSRGGSGTVYTSYSAESFVTEINNVYNAGYNEGYGVGEYNGEQNVINNPSTYDLYTQSELDDELLAGKVYVANLISDYWYNVCSTNNYSSCSHPSIDENNYTDDYVDTLLVLINDNAYLDGYADSQLVLLNYASSQNGTGMVYSSYDFTDFDNELVTIYSNGAAGTGSNVGYSGGYTAGVNSVTGNPNYYNLYTKQQYDNAVSSATSTGYSSGYQQGKLDYEDVDVSLPNTIISIASVPLVVLSSMFNFDILGINLFALITSILSLLIAIWVIKKIAGK